ncbi:hypothetical protein SK128_006109 [Halocaridina rubra]|uniref:Uncharacterized protein n=1 Tax=Halocaridina rubra TaxID=373956 RepID=A0AAN9A3T6_HALRR
MGAGSAKGLQPEHDDDDGDRLSNSSSTHWQSEDNSDSDDSEQRAHKKHNKRTVNAEVSSSAEPETPKAAGRHSSDQDSSDERDEPHHSEDEEKKKGEGKRKSFFKFSRKKSDHEKVDDFADESDDEGKKRRDSKKNHKKDGEKPGFKLFGWRNKKNEEKDAELDKDIDDLEKTFDSLGIQGKNMWIEDNNKARGGKSADDLELLEPMRKRKNIKVRGGHRGINGMVAGRNDHNASKTPGGTSSGSKRTFRYSWETENDSNKSPKQQEDEWEYKAVSTISSYKVPVLRHGLPFLPRARTAAFIRRTCFGRCNRYPECMPLLTSDRGGARTLDLTPQSRGHYRLSHGDYMY